MKLKKLFAGLVSGALAATTLASMATTSASAAEETKVLWESDTAFECNAYAGERADGNPYYTTFGNTLTICDGVGGDGETDGSKGIQSPEYWAEGSKIVIHFTQTEATYKKKSTKYDANLSTGFQIAGKVGDAWTWTELTTGAYISQNSAGDYFITDAAYDPEDLDDEEILAEAQLAGFSVDMSNPDDCTFTVDLSKDYVCDGNEELSFYDCITTMKELCIKGQDALINSVEITGDYSAPVFDSWIDNGDGSYNFNYTGANQSMAFDAGIAADLAFSVPAGYNAADVTAVNITYQASDWVTLSMGISDGTTSDWIKSDDLKVTSDNFNTDTTYTLETPNGVIGNSGLLKNTWMNANSKVQVTKLTFTIAGEEVPATVQVRKFNTQSIKYQLKEADGKKYMRAVYVDDQSALEAAESGSYSFGELKDVAITDAYKSIVAGGQTVSADTLVASGNGALVVTDAVEITPDTTLSAVFTFVTPTHNATDGTLALGTYNISKNFTIKSATAE